MVSLYRAWAAWRGMAGGGGAPDALVQAGGVRFAAHARLLAAHSGYFKSVLARPWPTHQEEPKPEEMYEGFLERREYDQRPDQMNEDHVLYVPNISAQQFWPLLAYMYTGYLELTPENIYQVLLATHLLHMPRALELCRNFLAQGSVAPLPTNVVKPIASRKLPPFLPTATYHPLYSEPPVPFMRAQHETPFRPVEPSILQIPTALEATEFEHTAKVNIDNQIAKDEGFRLVETSPTTSKQFVVEDERERSQEFVTTRPNIDAINLVKTKKSKHPKNTQLKKGETSKNVSEESEAKTKTEVKTSVSHSDEKVVIDVACCDGPVRFHRVLNTAYKCGGPEAQRSTSDSSDTDDSYIEIEEDSRSRSEMPYDNCNAFSKSLQKQMSENIRSMGDKHNENNPEEKVDGQDPDASNSDVSSKQETIYTCVYCNHTFKSQYCYQKHARRHINPVSIDAVNQGPLDTADGCCKTRKLTRAAAVPRREVRLLDMNVQYYPCKTCGSKFPSYYFVHKHRKMCHAEELDGAGDGRPHGPVEKRRRPIQADVSTASEEQPAQVAAVNEIPITDVGSSTQVT